MTTPEMVSHVVGSRYDIEAQLVLVTCEVDRLLEVIRQLKEKLAAIDSLAGSGDGTAT